MEEIVFSAKHREITGKQVKALRRAGRLPAVLYGHNIDPIAITLDLRETSRVLPTVTSSHLVTIDVEGDQHMALVRERQRHPVLGSLLHIDFLVVSMTERLRASVMLELEGEAPAVKEFNGVLVSALEQVEVECLPRDLPEKIKVDVSGLTEIGSALHVRDLVVPSKVDVLTDPDEMVVLVTAQAGEEEAAEVVEAVENEPEVIERGKKEEEEEF